MKNKFNKMMFALVASFALMVSTVSATVVNVQIYSGSFGSEVSWDLSDATGTIILSGTGYSSNMTYDNYIDLVDGCYDMNMYDSFGDGWNGGTYTVLDSLSGNILFTGGLTGFVSFGSDPLCFGPAGCTDPNADNYDANAIVDDGSCTYSNCTDLILTMMDSYGDGWNGFTFALNEQTSGTNFYSNTLPSGSLGVDTVCVPDGCYDVTVLGGSFASEVSWTLTDLTGAVVSSGGAPYTGTMCLPAVFGCTDPGASNYDALANTDDGSCLYPCIDVDTSESFEAGQGNTWMLDPNNTVGWTNQTGPTGSGSTGPAGAFDGSYYMYTETSGAGSNSEAIMYVPCVDATAWNNLAFVFAYHMYGATTGTLSVDVSTDDGLTWTEEWTLSGDQGDQWTEAIVDLGAYTTQISVRVQAETGTSFTSDMAIDLLRFMELPITGCTDPFADNYDPNANIDDGSCLFTGCTDIYASNYCSGCNVTDNSLCVYPPCNTIAFTDDFEANNLTANNWTTFSGVESQVSLTNANAIADTTSLQFEGGGLAGWVNPVDETSAYANTDHVSSSTICMDLTTGGANYPINLTFEVATSNTFTGDYSWIRVKVDGNVVADNIGNTSYSNNTLPVDPMGGNTMLTYDLTAYANGNHYITFETACKYGNGGTGSTSSSKVLLDNINLFEVTPCTYYDIAVNYAFGTSCFGGNDGQAMCLVVASNGGGDSYLWLNSSGGIVGNTSAVTGLSAGTYTCVVSDATNGCSASTTVLVDEPTQITGTGVVVNTTSALDSVGSIDLTAAGGTPCYINPTTYDALDAATGNLLGGMAGPYIMTGASTGNTMYFDVTNTGTAAIGITNVNNFMYNNNVPGNAEVWSRPITAAGYETSVTGWTQHTSFGFTATTMPSNGDYDVPLMVPIQVQPGQTVGVAFHTPGECYFMGNFGAGPFTTFVNDDGNLATSTGNGSYNGPSFGGTLLAPVGSSNSWSFSGRLDYANPFYTYAWTNGATTEDVSGLPVGPQTVTITDCFGCSEDVTFFINASADLGCTDPLADNYDATANTDDGSCIYYGCTDANATNFDSGANTDDGTCEYTCAYLGYDDELTVTVQCDFWGSEIFWQLINAQTGDTVALGGPYANNEFSVDSNICAYNGCYILEAQDTFGDNWGTTGWALVTNLNGDTLAYQDNSSMINGNMNTTLFSLGGGTCVYGCTDPTAANYNSLATIDNGSCFTCADNGFNLSMDVSSVGGSWGGSIWSISDAAGVLISNATYTGPGSFDTLCLADGCYIIEVTSGSSDADVVWTLDLMNMPLVGGGAPYLDTICFPATGGCTDPGACNYDAFATVDNGQCDYSCTGCIDPNAINYEPGQTIDDGSCFYCQLATSYSFIVDASALGAANGSIDIESDGSYCNADSIDLNAPGNNNGSYSGPFIMTGASTGNTFFQDVTNNGSIPLYVRGIKTYFQYTSAGTEMNSIWSTPGTANGAEQDPTLWTLHGEEVAISNGVLGDPGSKVATMTNILDLEILPGQTIGIAHHVADENYFWGNAAAEYDPNYWTALGLTSTFNMAEYNAVTPFTGTQLGGGWSNMDMWYIGPSLYSYVWSNGATTQDISGLNAGDYIVNYSDCYGCTGTDTFTVVINPVIGCTDPTAINFNPSANIDDGSCMQPLDGCMDSTAANYDPLATADDGSCHFCFTNHYVNITCGGGSWQGEVSWNLLDATGNVILSGGAPYDTLLCFDDGCYQIEMIDSFGDGWNGNFFEITEMTTGDVSSNTMAGSYQLEGINEAWLGCFTYGCTDILATNYDATANTDDGSCTYPPCLDAFASNEDFSLGYGVNGIALAGAETVTGFDTLANLGQGIAFHTEGGAPWGGTPGSGADAFADKVDWIGSYIMCVDLTQYAAGDPVNVTFNLNMEYSFSPNYAFMRLTADGTLLADNYGTEYHQAATATSDGWSTIQYDLSAYAGQTVSLSFDGVCKYPYLYYLNGDNVFVDNIVVSNTITPLYGCTDPLASNYSSGANTDDGSCCLDDWAEIQMFDTFGDSWNGNSMLITDAAGDTNFFSYGPGGSYVAENTCIATGCYEVTVDGGAWQNEVYWLIISSNGDTLLGSLTPGALCPFTGNLEIGAGSCNVGCTDVTAVNYDPIAQTDDGSCLYTCYDNSIYHTTVTDFAGSEMSWDVTDDLGYVVASYGNFPNGFNTVSDSTCFVDGCYTLNLHDAAGNGWISGTLGNVTLTDASGATLVYGTLPFGSTASYAFTVGTCTQLQFGCTDTSASNYDPLATADDGSCCVDGCMDMNSVNYDSLATCDDGSCIPFIYGCTDASALNYYPGANTDDGSCIYSGCTDPNASNYNPNATIDDGSCTYFNCASPVPTGLSVNWTTDTKASVSWDNMNDNSCMVFKYFVRFRVVNSDGTYGNWVTKSAGVGNGLCNFGLNTTEKRLQFLTAATTYQFKMKAFYCGGTESGYSSPATFTTGADCPPMTNLGVQTFNGNQAKATFSWDTTGAYVFARIALRVDTTGATWGTAGGFGIYYPTLTVNKFGLTPGQSYRAQGRTFCDSNVTSYRSTWTTPITWTQPGTLPIRFEGGNTINNLDVYPNPSRDIFNVTFVSEDVQDLEVKVINVVGEVVYTEALEQFVGEYTKQIDLTDNSKGVYFLEITTTNGVVNKKLIIQ